jgi:hypothetical protein
MEEKLKLLLNLSAHIRERIIKECRITRATLANWLNKKTPIPFWAKEKIDLIIMQETDKRIFFQQNEVEQKDESL